MPAPDTVYLYGVRPATEVLRHQPERIRRILLARDARPPLKELLDKFTATRDKRVVVTQMKQQQLDEQFPGTVHQGIVLELQPLPVLDETNLLDEIRRAVCGIFLVLDEVQDPHNLGAVLRVAEAAGALGIILPERRSAGINETVRKVSTGASEFVPIYEITNLSRTLQQLKKEDWWVIGMSREDQAKSLFVDKFPERTILVLGAEGRGVRPIVRAACDYFVSIPMYGVLESLNVSQAASVALYAYRQQHALPEGKVVEN